MKRCACLTAACLLALLFTLPAWGGRAAEQSEELLLGIEPEHNIFDQMERYRYLAAYLSNQLGVKVNLTIMSRYGEVIKRFRALRLDGAFLTSYTAHLGIRELDLEPVANPVNLNGESTAQGLIFVRQDSGIRDTRDMRGKSIVFVDPATMEGYLFPLAYFRRQGVTDTSRFFSRFYFSGSHASTIFAVLDGRADIGSAKNTVFNRLVQSDPSISQELRIIARSPKVPEVTLCITKEAGQGMRERLSAVLLNMDRTAEGRQVLAKFEALRFIPSERSEFDIIEQMAQEARESIAEHGGD